MKRWIIAALAALLVLGGTWYFASPALAMSGLRDALQEGDRDELTERVDFPAVRESLKSQMMAAVTAEMAKQKEGDNPFAALGAMFVTGLVNQMIEGLVTPDGLRALVQQGRLKADPSAKAPDQQWTVEHDGLDKFRAVPVGKPGEKAPKLLFKRDGLGGRLVDIEMPAGGLAPAGS